MVLNQLAEQHSIVLPLSAQEWWNLTLDVKEMIQQHGYADARKVILHILSAENLHKLSDSMSSVTKFVTDLFETIASAGNWNAFPAVEPLLSYIIRCPNNHEYLLSSHQLLVRMLFSIPDERFALDSSELFRLRQLDTEWSSMFDLALATVIRTKMLELESKDEMSQKEIGLLWHLRTMLSQKVQKLSSANYPSEILTSLLIDEVKFFVKVMTAQGIQSVFGSLHERFSAISAYNSNFLVKDRDFLSAIWPWLDLVGGQVPDSMSVGEIHRRLLRYSRLLAIVRSVSVPQNGVHGVVPVTLEPIQREVSAEA